LTHNKKVIELSSPGLWTFWDFEYANGTDPIDDWYNKDLSEEAQYTFISVLKDCQKVELPEHWGAFKRFLSGNLRDYRIWELWFHADQRQYRILGVFGPERKSATLLVGCYHKQGVYTPPGALETAYMRAKALAKGEAKRRERKIATDR
jgi:hypothetical protein